jgi:hypothetical protein
MQAPTHLATGILIEKATRGVKSPTVRRSLVVFLAVTSHGFLDRLARFTYHPPDPLFGDWFWTCYHLAVSIISIFIPIKCYRKYKLGLISSIIPDLDWLVLHSSKLLSLQVPVWKKPCLHEILFDFIDLLLPSDILCSLPDWNTERKSIVVELAFLAALAIGIVALDKEMAQSLSCETLAIDS